MQISRNSVSQTTFTVLHLIIHTSILFILSCLHEDVAVSTNVRDCQVQSDTNHLKNQMLESCEQRGCQNHIGQTL